jgi:hypothetical protein
MKLDHVEYVPKLPSSTAMAQVKQVSWLFTIGV